MITQHTTRSRSSSRCATRCGARGCTAPTLSSIQQQQGPNLLPAAAELQQRLLLGTECCAPPPLPLKRCCLLLLLLVLLLVAAEACERADDCHDPGGDAQAQGGVSVDTSAAASAAACGTRSVSFLTAAPGHHAATHPPLTLHLLCTAFALHAPDTCCLPAPGWMLPTR
jgi:hypothetical protein